MFVALGHFSRSVFFLFCVFALQASKGGKACLGSLKLKRVASTVSLCPCVLVDSTVMTEFPRLAVSAAMWACSVAGLVRATCNLCIPLWMAICFVFIWTLLMLSFLPRNVHFLLVSDLGGTHLDWACRLFRLKVCREIIHCGRLSLGTVAASWDTCWPLSKPSFCSLVHWYGKNVLSGMQVRLAGMWWKPTGLASSTG